jgi:hypothetical protein
MLAIFLTWCIASVYCSASKDSISIDSVFANPMQKKATAVLAVGENVLNSDSESFEFASAKIFEEVATILVLREPQLTKEELGAIELQTELILLHLKSSKPTLGNILSHRRQKSEVKPALKHLILVLRNKSHLVPRSKNPFLSGLSATAFENFNKFQGDHTETNLQRFRLSLRQYEKALEYLDNRQTNNSEETQHRLEFLYTSGYLLMLQESVNSYEMKYLQDFLELLNLILFSYYDGTLTKADCTAIKLQTQAVLSRLEKFNAEDLASYKHYLQTFITILEQIDDLSNPTNDAEITVSSIVAGDLLKGRISDRYEETLMFLRTHRFSENTDYLYDYLRGSVMNRRHIIPDYDEKEDIIAALDSAIVNANDSQHNYVNSIPGFYFLVKFWTNKASDLSKGVEAFRKLAKSPNLSFQAASALWVIADHLSIVNKPDWFAPNVISDFKARFPKNTESFMKTLTRSAKDSIGILEIIAANFLTNFTTPLITRLIEEFEKPQYDRFCPGSDQFRYFLKTKSRTVKIS